MTVLAPAVLILWAIRISYGLLTVSAMFALLRVASGPSLPDRLVGLLCLWYCASGFLIVFAMQTQRWSVLDLVLVLSLVVAFVPLACTYRARADRPNSEAIDADAD